MNENTKKTPLIWVLIATAVLLGGAAYFTRGSQSDTVMKQEESTMEKGDTEREEGEAMMDEKNDAMMETGEAMTVYKGKKIAGDKAVLLEFNKADYDAAIASDKLVVLYFYANWCPVCKEETANAFYPAFNELTTDEVIGFLVNYKDSDTDNNEKALAAQYGIPYQHTKVFVKNGKQILKAPDGWNKARYLEEIEKAITR